MLSRLLVDNLLVIGHAELELGPGLTIITGETGAGKTMLTTAIRLVGGEKADGALVGPRGDEAYVEAEFDDEVPSALADVADPSEVLVLARRLRKEGNARALCCGRSCSAEQLRAATDELISLTGQHAARRLVDAGVQMDILDGSAHLFAERELVGEAYRCWHERERELTALRTLLADGERRLELLRLDVESVRALAPTPGEEEELASARERLRHVDALRSATLTAAQLLDGGDDGDGDVSALTALALAERELVAAGAHDPQIAELASTLADASETVLDVVRNVRVLAEAYDSDPARLDEIESRLRAITDLRRRFQGLDIESILVRAEAAEVELSEIEGGDERAQALEAECEHAKSAYDQAATKLSQARKLAAKQLVVATERHLHDLGLAGAKLLVELPPAAASARGSESVHMLLVANPGLEPAALDKGASGGELSRVNLALLLAGRPARGTWIFDEVDAGIGGATAHVVATKLKDLAEHTQVIVVTHLAQIAVRADHHLVVSKDSGGEFASTVVRELVSESERERELARLIGADADDQAAAQTAAQLLRDAAGR
jgi:DNA repair protein RecN (Recombination protein N)